MAPSDRFEQGKRDPQPRPSTSSTAEFGRHGGACCGAQGPLLQPESRHFVQLLSMWLHKAKREGKTIDSCMTLNVVE